MTELKFPVLRKKSEKEGRRTTPNPLDERIREGDDTSGPWIAPKQPKRPKDATSRRVDLWFFSVITITAGGVLMALWPLVGAGVIVVGIVGFVAYLLE